MPTRLKHKLEAGNSNCKQFKVYIHEIMPMESEQRLQAENLKIEKTTGYNKPAYVHIILTKPKQRPNKC